MTDTLVRTRFQARFSPQAWVNDHAIDVDPQGPTTWDATDAVASMPAEYRDQLVNEIDADDPFGWGEALDAWDWLHDDPNAPQWVRDWSGPFSIWVSVPEPDETAA
mgnify:CR=1 FL=1